MLTRSPFYTVCLSLLLTLLLPIPDKTAQANENFRAKLMQAADKKASGAYVRTRFLQSMNKPFRGTRKKVLLIGDSHAQDFYNAIKENGFLRNAQISTRYIPTRCQMYLGKQAKADFLAAKDQQLCRTSDSLKKALPVIKQANVIILAANWRQWSAQRLPETIRQMGISSGQKLVVIGRKSYGRVNVRSYLRMQPAQLRSLRNAVDKHQVAINQLMRRTLPAHVFVDQQKQVCNDQRTCPLFTSNLELISFDGGHFTPAGARYVGKKLFRHPILRGL